MAGRSFSIILSALILIVIGGWFIITSLLPLLDIDVGGYYSVTTQGVIFYLYFSDIITDVKILQWIFPVLGVLGVLTGFMLLGGKGRGLGIVAYIVTLILAVLGIIVVFAFMGIDTLTGYWEYLKDAFTSGDIITALGYLLEPLLITVGSIIGLIAVLVGKTKQA